jgi:hypothetical protein
MTPPRRRAAAALSLEPKQLHGQGDIEFLKRSFAKLMLNFSWWVNRKVALAKIFRRAWVSLCCQNMLEMSFEEQR